ncbi:MAG TPA: hypothetical protein VEV45_01650 [Streptosporangiaceae bacterium]|nr:hypothetical protein [Streptosporangiaceae bacterium]
MGRALGWTLIVLLVLLIGDHPGTAIGLMQDFVRFLHAAGDELSAFINVLSATPGAPTPTPVHTRLPVTG